MADKTSGVDRRDAGPVKTRRTNVGGRSFSSRNPTTIGAIGLVLIAVVLWTGFNAGKLPIIGGGTTYTAAFTESAGLQKGADVRIAGLTVGKVDAVELKGDHVEIKFRVKNAWIGNASTVAIKLKTLLGAKYLAVDSLGDVKQKPADMIPVSRTMSPFDIYPAFTELTQTIDQINTDQLSKAFTVLADDFRGTPSSVKSVVTGLTRLSETISSRDQQLRTLLARANQVTGVLADRDQELQRLLSDGSLLLEELNSRRAAINSLLINTTLLSQQLQGLVADNEKTLGPALDNLNGVLSLLQRNQDSLDRGLALLAPFFRVFNNSIGNGRWFDNYICNLSLVGVLGVLGATNGAGECK